MSPRDPRIEAGVSPKTAALLACRVAQFNSYSCSVAAVATVVNAIRRLSTAPGAFRPLPQEDILRRVDCHHWRERVSEAGYRGLHGMPLPEFGDAAAAALEACGIAARRVETIAVHGGLDDLAARWENLRRALLAQAGSPTDFLIAHFTQGEYFGDWFGGHISPVGAYDPRSEEVLVLDVDPECPAPYWVNSDRFFKGLVGRKKVIGAGGGGYVRIELVR
jgi:hypothetical protein